MNNTIIQIFPTIALFLFIIGEIAQLVKSLREKKTGGISSLRYATQILIGILFSTYYFFLGHYVVLGFNLTLLAVSTTIFVLCITNKKGSKRNE